MVSTIGFLAAALTTVAFLPQVIKNWKTKSAGDLSFGMYGLFVCGVALWLMYGVLLEDVPIILANAVTLALSLINLGQMVWYRYHKESAISQQ